MFYNYKNSAISNEFLRVVAGSTFFKKILFNAGANSYDFCHFAQFFREINFTKFFLKLISWKEHCVHTNSTSDAQNARRHATTGENWVGRKKPANEFFGAVLAALWLESSHLPNFTGLRTYLLYLFTYKHKEIWLVVIFTSSTVFPLE